MNSLDTITEADFDKTMAINVKAPMFATQVAARKMVEQGHGSIVAVSYPHLDVYKRQETERGSDLLRQSGSTGDHCI